MVEEARRDKPSDPLKAPSRSSQLRQDHRHPVGDHTSTAFRRADELGDHAGVLVVLKETDLLSDDTVVSLNDAVAELKESSVPRSGTA
jgi:hypothetical protein